MYTRSDLASERGTATHVRHQQKIAGGSRVYCTTSMPFRCKHEQGVCPAWATEYRSTLMFLSGFQGRLSSSQHVLETASIFTGFAATKIVLGRFFTVGLLLGLLQGQLQFCENGPSEHRRILCPLRHSAFGLNICCIQLTVLLALNYVMLGGCSGCCSTYSDPHHHCCTRITVGTGLFTQLMHSLMPIIARAYMSII